MASIREAPCNKELFSKINLGILKIFLVLSKIHLGSKFLAARDSPPVWSAATRQVADKGSTPPKKKLAAGRGHSRIPLLNKRHPRLGPSRSRGSLPEWTVDRVFFRKASHPLKKSSLTRVPTPHHPEPGKHSPQIPAGLCGCICRCNYKHKQKIECFLFSAGAETKSNALCWS